MKRIRILEHSFEIHFFLAIRTNLLLANYTPSTDAKFMESEIVAKEHEITENVSRQIDTHLRSIFKEWLLKK